MPTIGIDARKYFDLGIGTYIQNLTHQLPLCERTHRYVLFVNRNDRAHLPMLEEWTIRIAPFKKYSVGEMLLFAGRATEAGVDLFHSPHYTLPFRLKSKSVVTIHDLIPLRFPEYFSAIKRVYAYSIMNHAVRSADAVITVSEFTRKDILETFRIDPDKVHVIYNGVHTKFARLTDSSKVMEFKRKHRIENAKIILYVGSVKPHKNVETLMMAFSKLRRRMPHVLLIFAGEALNMGKGLPELIGRLSLNDSIRELGRLTDDELVVAYNAADVLVMPSRYEGFGLPVLEAMACGTPVIASTVASVPEIVGEAGILVDPEDSDWLSASLETILSDISLRQRLVELGMQRAAKFSWRDTAEKTLRLYNRVLGN